MLTPNVKTDHPPLEAEEDETPTVKRITNPDEDELEELELGPFDEVTQELEPGCIEALEENAPEQPVLPPNRQGISGWQTVAFLLCLLSPHDVQAWWLLENRSTQPQEVEDVRP